MKTRIFLLACAGSLALAGTPAVNAQGQTAAQAPAWPQAGSDLPADPDFRFGTLPNGMRYAIRRNQTPPGEASLRLRIDSGSLNESEDQRGLAHFIEHMVLNGTTNVPEGEFIRRLERHGLRFGPDTNASTDFGQTLYKLDLPETDAETVDTALFLLREVADEATFLAASIDSERGIIQSEERTRATPGLRALIDQFGFLFPEARLSERVPIGLPEVIANAQRDRFLAYYNAFYRPERATLIAVGDFDVAEMERKIRERFSSWRGEGAPGRDASLGTPAPRRDAAKVFVEAGLPSQVVLNWVRPLDTRPDSRATRTDRFARQLVMQVLNRRLERIAATQSPAPFVQSVAADVDNLFGAGRLTQIVAIARPGEWQPALRAIETEQRRLAEHGIGADEISREIAQMRTALTAAAAGAATRTSASLAEGLANSLEQGDVFIAPAEQLRLFEAAAPQLTAERVNAAARTLFAGDPLLYMTSPTPIEGSENALLAAYRQSRGTAVAAAAAEQTQAWPYTAFGTPGQVVERRELPAPIGATAVRFANGVTLTVKPTQFADDQILVGVRAGYGFAGTPADRPNPTWPFVFGVFPTLGTQRMSYEDMQAALASRTYSIAFAAEGDAFQLSGATRPEDLALQMQVLTAYVADPGWRSSGWDRVRSVSATIQDQLAATPSTVFARESGRLLHGGDRRWALPTQEEMSASTVADAQAVLGPAFAQGPIEVIMVGDVTVDEAIRQTAATFGALPPRPNPPEPAVDVRFPAPNAEPVRLTHNGRADQGLAYIGWPTTGFYGDPRQARILNLLSDVYELRLLQRIREEQGTTYSPQANHEASEAFDGYGTFSALIEARPEALAGFLRDAEAIAGDLRDRPIDADELQRALRPRLEAIQRQMNGNAWWLANLARIQADPRVAGSLTSLTSDYGAITAADLQRAARQYLRAGGAYRIIVVPREGAAAPAS